MGTANPVTLNARQANFGRDVSAQPLGEPSVCLLYTSDDADDLHCVDLGGRRIIKKTNTHTL